MCDNCPIHPQAREIRLLEVLPWQSGQAIRCRLNVFSLSERPPYVALSYTWGGPSDNCKDILLHERAFAVRKNLFQFLHRVSKGEIDIRQLLWIDALCIDQFNVQERNHQVRMMRDIYTQADEVAVWLGDASPEEHKLIAYLENSASEKLFTRQISNLFVRRFCNHEYWSRVWIIQEVICARTLSVYWGNQHFS